MTGLDFPSVRYVYDQLATRLGARIVVVPSDDGISIDTQRIVEILETEAKIRALPAVYVVDSSGRTLASAKLRSMPDRGDVTPEQLDSAKDGQVVVLADHTKIGKQALAFLCELSAVDTLIVDAKATPEQRQLVEAAGVRLVVAGEAPSGEEFRS